MPQSPAHSGTGMAVTVVLTVGAVGWGQDEAHRAPTAGPSARGASAWVAGGGRGAPAAALVSQAGQAGGVRGTGCSPGRAEWLQEEERDLLGGRHAGCGDMRVAGARMAPPALPGPPRLPPGTQLSRLPAPSKNPSVQAPSPLPPQITQVSGLRKPLQVTQTSGTLTLPPGRPVRSQSRASSLAWPWPEALRCPSTCSAYLCPRPGTGNKRPPPGRRSGRVSRSCPAAQRPTSSCRGTGGGSGGVRPPETNPSPPGPAGTHHVSSPRLAGKACHHKEALHAGPHSHIGLSTSGCTSPCQRVQETLVDQRDVHLCTGAQRDGRAAHDRHLQGCMSMPKTHMNLC